MYSVLDSNKIFEREVKKGIEWRYPNGFPDCDEYQERLNYEMEVIISMGYADYLLVVKDFLEYGRLLGFVPKNKIEEAPLTITELKEYIHKNGWKNGGLRIGPGRGSAVGSLVCYLLGITALDPIKYGLLFERFLNPERVSMPDIDSDISATTRQKVIQYVQNKYGEKAVCGIMTTNAQAPKGAINIAAKYYGLKTYQTALTSLGREMAKMVPSDVGTSFLTKVDDSGKVDPDGKFTLLEYMKEEYKHNTDALEILHWASVTEGCFTAYGAHAAGIVISDNDDVSDYLPLRWNSSSNMFTTQCDMVQTEENGLLKFDFLGLKTLDIITETLFMIESDHGLIIDPLTIPLDDEKVFKTILSTGKTNSVFQLESAGMKNMLKRFKPTCFEDLIILVSMFRPGPMQYLDNVIDVKNGKEKMTFLCPELKPILGKTYGAIVYQEQVMQICQSLAGFTFGHADMVRRFMSKKKDDKLAHERESFIDGCINNGISKDIASELFDQMMDFAKYAFNKSHAAAYAFNAYVTAWLKCYYPAEFFASALNWAPDGKKIAGLMNEAKLCGVKVSCPDINNSAKEFCVVDGVINFGLSMVSGVKNHADDIIEERELNGPFLSVKDVCRRLKTPAYMENLICAGAFDRFGKNREMLKDEVIALSKLVSDRANKLSFLKSAEVVLPVVESLSTEELIELQISSGVKPVIKEATTVAKLENKMKNAEKAIANIDNQISLIHIKEKPEDKLKRMNLEKEYLGIYVTEHPMDYFDVPEKVGCDYIANAFDQTISVYGVITKLEIKHRKKDNAKFAVMEIEDRSGSMTVTMFSKSYSRYEKMIKENEVFIFEGNCVEDEFANSSEDDGTEEAEPVYKFIANDLKTATKKQSALLIEVPSYAVFHVDMEDTIREMYEDVNGKELYISDLATKQVRKALWRADDSIRNMKVLSIIDLYI